MIETWPTSAGGGGMGRSTHARTTLSGFAAAARAANSRHSAIQGAHHRAPSRMTCPAPVGACAGAGDAVKKAAQRAMDSLRIATYYAHDQAV